MEGLLRATEAQRDRRTPRWADSDPATPVDNSPRQVERLATLTPREVEVVALGATGMSSFEIADRMYLSPFTVRAHVQRAMTRLEARDRAQLVAIAYQTGLVGGTSDGSPSRD